MTCLLFYLRYSHNALRFTNHVGEQRNFCKQKCDVPLLVCLSNSTLSAQRSAYFFKALYGTTFPHTARLHKFMNNQTLPLRNGLSRAPAPTSCSDKFAVPQNRYALCGFYVVLWDRKSGAEFFYSDTALILLLVCFSSIAFLHRFCRLAPIEALPQAPQGTLSLDPASPLTPGLSLRFISRFARC